mgnify:CR=1 FL=1
MMKIKYTQARKTVSVMRCRVCRIPVENQQVGAPPYCRKHMTIRKQMLEGIVI